VPPVELEVLVLVVCAIAPVTKAIANAIIVFFIFSFLIFIIF
jgi:hypothetical protein